MGSRWARVARGLTAAGFATFVAALSHSLAGGMAPSVFSLVVTLVIAAAICTLLAGRTVSAWRLAASVALSQALFHGVFSTLGMPLATAHAHSSAGALASAPAMTQLHGGATMWLAHGIAALITVVAFLHAERAFWGISGTAKLFFSRLLTTVIPLSPAPTAARISVERRFVPRDLTVLLSSMRHRGPPELTGRLRPVSAASTHFVAGSNAATHRHERNHMKRSTMSTIAITAGLALAVGAPLAASAHVSVDPTQAAAGSYSVITFKVPNESETAGTTKVEVSLPTDTPFTSVRYVPVAGWTAELVSTTLPEPVTVGESEITEAVTSVIWTADPGSEITAGELQLFPLSVGPVPDTGSIVLPADQTYSDGSVVSWSETEEDAEHPAPVLYVNDAPVDHHAATTDDSHDEAMDDASHDEDMTISAASDTGSPDVLARVLGAGGLVLGVVALVLAIVARRPAAK